MGGRKGIGKKQQTQPDLGPAGLAKETLLNRSSTGVSAWRIGCLLALSNFVLITRQSNHTKP
jgi:hypothetical protein